MSSTKVTYKVYDTALSVAFFLKSVPQLVACDFEATCIFTKDHKVSLKDILATDETLTFEQRRVLKQHLLATALSNPCFVSITHMSLAWSETEAHVIIVKNQAILNTVLSWIVNTTKTQIWHHAAYDLKLVHYLTGRFPKAIEDTQVFAKCLLNHVINSKALTRLKLLMGYKYGNWAVAPDMFDNPDIYDPVFIEYAATDACATYVLYNNMHHFTEKDHPCNTCSPN